MSQITKTAISLYPVFDDYISGTLDKINARRTAIGKVSKSEFIRGLILAAMQSGIDFTDCSSDEQIAKKMLDRK
jgi:hypothetical protein